ncbi:S41 family peptidase [Parapedobacter sp. DT-150]|uniref:S41 family peptidase n=1 Tax=Parapedobacter sp. DT-150 TaxID=3396162 RepID=UPI003F1D7364
MRTFFIFTVLCFSSLLAFSQKLELEKASPFTAVKWEKGQPVVQVENEWYHLEKLDAFTTKELLDFCKERFGPIWQKRFSEDLVEVLRGMGYEPTIKVTLQLSKGGISNTYTGAFTYENRRSSLLYNRSNAESKFPQKISTADAIADLRQFEDILQSVSSYSQLSTFDYQLRIKELADAIDDENTQVDVNKLANEMAKIMAEIGDRHSSIKNEAFNDIGHKTYGLKLPFGVATLNGKIIALKKDEKSETYSYYYRSYPFLKSIDGVAIETLINTYNYRDKKAPAQAKLSRGSSTIQNYGALLFANDTACPDSIKVVFGDGSVEKTEIFLLTKENKGYTSKLSEAYAINTDKLSEGNFNGLSKIVGDNIGYIIIPQMYDYDEVAGLENFIKNTLRSFSNTKALIIDIRNNPGGSRAILQTFAGYIVQPEQSPWVANVAYLRTDRQLVGDEPSMSGRYLYSYNSEELSDNDRKAIDQFSEGLKLQKTVDDSKFSGPFYMVLHHGGESYRQPVYMLVNEESFSAASVFTSVFKGLPNVKIAGETTDGSSGNSRILHLKNSNIRIRVSTMLSFQRNGKTLDGNGTIPDIVIQTDEKQVLNGYDTQLTKLIKIINRSPGHDGF